MFYIFSTQALEQARQSFGWPAKTENYSHPQMAGRYQKEIRNLIGTLNQSDLRAEASQMLRTLIRLCCLESIKRRDKPDG